MGTQKFFRPLIIATAIFATACSESPAPVSKAAPAVQALRLYVFQCGTIDVNDISAFHPGVGKGQKKRLTDSCYLIAHPKGTLIWDTGLPAELVKLPDGKSVMDDLLTLRVTKTLADQLKEIGYAPESITYLGISHMHLDHTSNTTLFPKATLLIQKEEYDAAFGPEPGKYGFDPTSYPTLRANPLKTLQGDHDVFGDGSVTIKRMLGHTPGHQALYIKLPKTGNILLSGDLVHFTENWEKRYVPSFNFDKPLSAKTMEDVAKFLKDNNATLWIQHDLEQNETIKHSPEFYE